MHVGLSYGWLRRLAWQDKKRRLPCPAMPSVRSFAYTGPFWYFGQPVRCPDAATLLSAFPSLTHADIPYRGAPKTLWSQFPPILSLRLNIDCLHMNTGSRFPMPGAGARSAALPIQSLYLWGCGTEREKLEDFRSLLNRTPALQQLAITRERSTPLKLAPRAAVLLPALRPLNNLTYLQLDGALSAADWLQLLTPTSPPAFAASLLHLALTCYPEDRDRVGGLLPSLPSMYPALTHCHVCTEYVFYVYYDSDPPSERWRAAISELKAALGAVWCERVGEMTAWRADAVWRREANIQVELRVEVMDDGE